MRNYSMKSIDIRARIYTYLLLISLLLFFTPSMVAQMSVQMSDLGNLSKVKSSQVSDAQLKEIVKRGEQEGVTPDEAFNLAVMRGLPASEAAVLRRRAEELMLTSSTTVQSQSLRRNELPEQSEELEESEETLDDFWEEFIASQGLEDESRLKIFGSQLFSKKALTFEPSMNIPTPTNYVLGAGDEIQIDIWGAATNRYVLPVLTEGSVLIDNIGPVFVHGLTIEAAEKKIVAQLKQLYRGLRPGEPGQDTFAQVSLGRVRSIQVTVVGEVEEPGNYLVSSLTTVFNALYRAKGLNEVGSYRNIEVIRDNKVVTTLDVYDFLLRGDQTDNIRLQDQDVIKVGVYESLIEIDGEVNRPGYYQVKKGEYLSDLIQSAGGFSSNAYSRQVTVKQKTAIERKIVRVHQDDYSSFELQNGDVIEVGALLTRFSNRVVIEGAVWRPGEYALTEGMTLSQLLVQAEGVRPEAFRTRGLIYRLSDIHDFYVESFNINEVLESPESYDIPLQYEDSVVIRNIYEMREEMEVSLFGEVQNPGSYSFNDKMTLGDLILAGNGFKASASEARVEVYRRIHGLASPKTRGDIMADSYTFLVSRDLILEGDAKEFILQPYDQVYVRRRPDYQSQQSVRIEGEVLYPGEYVLRSRHERISDIVARAGGFTNEAYITGATLKRRIKEIERVDVVIASTRDEVVKVRRKDFNYIGISMDEIMKHPGKERDLMVREGDVITVPPRLQTVAVDGAVLRSSETRYIPGKRLRYYISNSGGFAENARKKNTYVIYANGDVSARKSYLFFRTSPKITPGSEIVVPEKVVQARLTPGERISILTSVVSMAAVVATAISRF